MSKVTIIKSLSDSIKSWTIFEIALLASSTLMLIIFGSIHANDAMSIISIFAAIIGILGAILMSKGRMSSFVYSSIYSLLYIVILIDPTNPEAPILMGSVLLHAVFYIPTNIIGFIEWMRNSSDNGEVHTKRLSLKGILTTIVLGTATYVSYGYIVQATSELAQMIWIDSALLIAGIFASVFNLARYVDQWAFWIIAEVINTIIRTILFIDNGGAVNIIFLILAVGLLINSFYGMWNWFELSRKAPIDGVQLLHPNQIAKLNPIKRMVYYLDAWFTKDPSKGLFQDFMRWS